MKKTVYTKKAPAAIGPYSQGTIGSGEMVFVSGQLPFIPETGMLLEGTIEDKVKQSLKNIEAILNEAGANIADIVKVTIFITDMNKFGDINKAYSEIFTENCPARSVVEVARLPKDSEIEIEAIAIK